MAKFKNFMHTLKIILISVALAHSIIVHNVQGYNSYHEETETLYISDSDHQAENIGTLIAQHPSLRSLQINCSSGQLILTQATIKLLSSFPSLTKLHLEGNVLTDPALFAALPATIQGMQLSSSTQLTNECLMHLPPQLRTLKISLCPRITGIVFAALPLSLTYLELYNFFSHLDNNGFRNLPPHLHALKLNTCIFLINSDLKTLPPTIESLELNNCPQITDAGLALLPTSIRHLSIFSYNGAITDDSLNALHNLPLLTTLEIHGCENLSDAGLQGLKQEYQHITIIRY